MSVEFIAVGASLGGLDALHHLFSELSENFPIPIAVVIHRSSSGSVYLVESLQRYTRIRVQEASDKLSIDSSGITVAPADYHLLVDSQHYALSLEGPINYARPSIDVLFESAAQEYGAKALGIILTGGGRDGVRGLQAIKSRKGAVFVQSPESAEDATLPQAILDAQIVLTGSTLEQLASEIATNAVGP